MHRPAGLLHVAVVGVVAVGLGGCGAGVERDEAAAAAGAFTASVAVDPSAACRLLAPSTLESVEKDGESCPEALAGSGVTAGGEPTSVAVAGHSAQVRYRGDTVFLALFDEGWRVTAAGCRRDDPDPSVPYDCTVEGD
jgi:hypothetical protein